MMISRFAVAGIVLSGLVIGANPLPAQNTQSVEPIVLTSSPDCCQSPAAASEPVALPCGDRTYLRAEDQDPVRLARTSSRMIPLPTQEKWRHDETRVQRTSRVQPVSASRTVVRGQSPAPVTWSSSSPAPAVSPSRRPVCVYKPVTVVPATPVPDGYVLGTGLIGQPKLYKPGQPIRNFLRFITL